METIPPEAIADDGDASSRRSIIRVFKQAAESGVDAKRVEIVARDEMSGRAFLRACFGYSRYMHNDAVRVLTRAAG
jgi:hypothetical protein